MKGRARVVGAGLIGTSIALKLIELGWAIEIDDLDPVAKKLGEDLLGSGNDSSGGEAELVVIATPPKTVFDLLMQEFQRNPKATFIDVSSTKTNLQRKVKGISGVSERFISTHPIAGREVSGARGARSDLFESRAWIITPSAANRAEDVEAIRVLISELGATPYLMSAEEHDRLFARLSHLPQVISTALANSIAGLRGEIDIAGQGLRDQLRLAGSSGGLWSGILSENREEVIAGIDEFIAILMEIRRAIEDGDEKAIQREFMSGNEVQARLSGKHGAKPRAYEFLNVVIADKPGQLGALFNECAEVSANVEDISLEHSPKQETGLIQLALAPGDSDRLLNHLLAKGWKVHRA